MNNLDKQYFELINYIIKNGVKKSDRTGTGTISIFDYTMKFNMSDGFPLLTSKKMFTKGIIHELIWFLKGDTNIKYLVDNGVHIWDGDAYKNFEKNSIIGTGKKMTKEEFIEFIKTDNKFASQFGDLGPIYGHQWRNLTKIYETCVDNSFENGAFEGCWCEEKIDQIQNLINELKSNPDSRRLMVNAWNPLNIEDMVLPPCHYGFQCYTQLLTYEERTEILVSQRNSDKIFKSPGIWINDIGPPDEYLDKENIPKRKLSLKFTMRSVDCGLGLPFNIASYGILLHLIAREVNMIPGDLIFSGGDCHIYLNHIDSLKEQLKNKTFELPKLELSNDSIDTVKYTDIKIIDYVSSDVVKMDLSN